MAHIPVNHPLRPLCRVVGFAVGAYVLVVGVVGLLRSGEHGFFDRTGLPEVLGVRVNPAFAVLSIVVGLALVVGAVIGGNVDQVINITAGVTFLVAGFVMLALLRTELNLLGFTMTTCIVSFGLGIAALVAGLYGREGSAEEAAAEEAYRHGAGGPANEAADSARRDATTGS